jgi:hypothetical protein
MALSCRAFLKCAAAALAFSTTIDVQAGGSLSQRQKVDVEIKSIGSQPFSKGPADWFAGAVASIPCCKQALQHLHLGPLLTLDTVARTAWRTCSRSDFVCHGEVDVRSLWRRGRGNPTWRRHLVSVG